MINKTIATAGALSLALTAVHIIGGGMDFHAPILASELAPGLKGISSVVWHGITASLLLCSGIYFLASTKKPLLEILTGIVIVQYLTYALLFLFYGITRFGSVMIMPQWIAFMLIIIVAFSGILTERRAKQNRPLDT